MKSICLCLGWLAASLFFTGCDLIRYHPYEKVESGPMGLTQHNLHLIEQLGVGRDTLRLAFLSDTQRHYDDTEQAIHFINRLADLDFVLHGGDFTDFGLADEYIWSATQLSTLKCPWLSVIGNHDFLGTGEHNYMRVFGPLNYSVNVGHLHLVCLNTNSREQEYQVPVPDFAFLEQDIKSVMAINEQVPDSITHTLFLMHARPGDEQFNNNVSIAFMIFVRQYPGMKPSSPVFAPSEVADWNVSHEDREQVIGTFKYGLILNGHNHHHTLVRALDDNCLFYGIPDIKEREIYLFTLTPDGFTYEMLEF